MTPRRLSAAIAAGALAIGAALCTASPASAATAVPHRPAVKPAPSRPGPGQARPFAATDPVLGDALKRGDTMAKDQVLVSLGLPANGQDAVSSTGFGTYLILQGDGNLVEYEWTTNAVLWQSDTVGLGDHLVFQADGNLVLYSATNAAVWNTRTDGTAFDTFTVYGNGELDMFDSTNARSDVFGFGTAVTPAPGVEYALAVSPGGDYSFVVQGDGNMVIYSTAGGTPSHPVWNTLTNNAGKVRLLAQADGNLVAYSYATGRVVFNTHTDGVLKGQPAFYQLDMQDDGNLVLYATAFDTTGHAVRVAPVWSSGTRGVA